MKSRRRSTQLFLTLKEIQQLLGTDLNSGPLGYEENHIFSLMTGASLKLTYAFEQDATHERGTSQVMDASIRGEKVRIGCPSLFHSKPISRNLGSYTASPKESSMLGRMRETWLVK